MATKRTYINADEELVIKGQLTIEGNVTQIETTQQVTNLQGNVFTINSDGDNTTAQLKLNSNGNFGTLSFTDGGNIVAEPGLQGNLYVGSGQQVFIEGGGSIGGSGFTGNLTGTASNADALSSAVTLNLTGDVTGSATFINAGDTASITTDISNTAVTPNTYGNATNVGQFTVASDGRLTQADSILIAIPSSQVTDFTTAVRGNISITDAGGDGSLAYDSGNGIITYTGPSLAEVQARIDNSAANVRAHFSGGDGIDLASGVIDVDSTVVRTSGDQSIAGEKTFTGQVNISANIIPTTANTFNLGSYDNHFDEIFANVVHAERLDLGDADLTDIHNTFYAGTPTGNILQSRTAGGLTYEHNGPGSLNPGGYYRVNTGDGLQISSNALTVDSTVVRTSGTQSIGGEKTFTSDVEIQGNLNVTANINSATQTDLYVEDTKITLANGAVANTSAFIYVEGNYSNNPYLKWNENAVRWQFSNDGTTDNNILLISDLSAGTGLTFASNVFSITNTTVGAGDYGDAGTVATFTVNAQGQLTAASNATIDITSSQISDFTSSVNSDVEAYITGGDGIDFASGTIDVDSTVIRTTGDQSLGNVKTFTGKLLLPTTDVTTENAIFTDSNEAWVYVNGSKKQITPTSSLGTAEQANSSLSYSLVGSTTGTSTYELYAGKRTVGVDDFHAIKGLEEGTYTSLSETATAVTIEADISAIRGAFSVIDNGGDGSLAYNSGTGVITYTGPSASEVRSHLSGSGLIGYNSGTGVISTSADNYGGWNFETDTSSSESVSSGNLVSILGGSGIDVTHSGKTITVTNTNSADITGVIAGSGLSGGGLSGTVTLDIGAGTGISVAADTISVDMSAFSTTNLIEGSNLYYTNTRADARVNLQTGTNLDLSSKNTDELSEGSSNLYYTDARVRNAISVGGDLSYDSANGVISFTNDAGDIESVSITAGTGLTGTASASSGAFSTTLNVTGLTVSELAPTSLLTSSETFADSDTQLMTAKAIDDRIISKGYSTTTGTVTQVNGGSGLTGSVTTSGSLAVGAGNYILVGSNDVGVDATNQNIANKVVARDGSGNFAAGTITATATQAQYADLAENYVADESYEPGTVLVIGGEHEVSVTEEAGSYKVVGVVSTDPAHLMNVDCEGEHVVAVALRGRVPCKVIGNVNKGDVLVASDTPGYAMVGAMSHTLSPLQIVGRSLETKTDAMPGIVEIIV
jgi:hypothetical protein